MRIVSAKLRDLFSIGEVELDLANKGLVLVNGFSHDEKDPNGSGKSSLAHKALSWCLWGQTAIGAKADKVKRKGAKSAFAEVVFEGQDNKTYKVTRTRGPNSLKFELLLGGEWNDLSQKLEKETQPLIDQALGRNFQSWLQSDFFGQGRKLSYAELTPAVQKSVLDEILPLEQLFTWETRASELGKQLDEERLRIDKEIMKCAGSISTLTRSISEIQVQHDKAASVTQIRIADLSNSVAQAEAIQAKLAEDIAETDKQLGSISNNVETERDTLVLQRRMHEQGYKEIEAKRLEIAAKIVEWNKYSAVLEAKRIPVQATCPTCDRDFEEIHLEKVKAANADIDIQLNVAAHNLKQANEFLKYTLDKISAYSKELHEIVSRIQVLENSIANKLLLQKQRKLSMHMYDNASADLLKRELEATKNAPNPFAVQLAQTKENLTACSGILAKFQEELAASVKTKERVDFWKSAFKKDIKNLLYREITDFLNTRANYYLSEMGNPQLKIEFSTVKEMSSGETKEDFNVQVSSETGGETYDMLSGGEQQLSSFAIGLSLADLAGSQSAGECKFMVLDEPFTNLGPTNCERLIDFIQRILVPRKDTILVISNEQSLQELIATQIFVEKRDGITSLGGNS